jgi:hypothetical protein
MREKTMRRIVIWVPVLVTMLGLSVAWWLAELILG